MKKIIRYIIPVFLLIVLLFLVVRSQDSSKDTPESNNLTTENQLILPESWFYSEDNQGATLKIEKLSDNDVRPGIILLESDLPPEITPKTYVDNLIKGARSTLPSLKIISDKESVENYYLRSFNSSYTINGQKINIIQRIYVIDSQVYTLTASYLPVEASIESDVEQIFNSIFQSEIISN
ncbi:MAG: hypothetical protein ACOX6N_02080 [Patescibacteria group bacterium]|jgi:hypothetical protein